ncbi:MAG: glycosyltransferase family 9 protein [Vulcanimicrobiaceae bacterium]
MNEPALVVLRALGLGDFLTAVPAYRALARAFPNHRRTLAAPRALHPLVALLGETFAAAYDVAPLGPLPADARGVDVAVNLHGRGPQSHRTLLELGPGRLLAFACDAVARGGRARVDGPVWRDDEHDVSRWSRMLRYHNVFADARELALAVPQIDLPDRLRDVTVVHPGAASEARRWPVARWAAVARACVRAGERVVVTGSDSARALTAAVVRDGGLARESDLAGRTSLLELAGIVARARRVLCGDTGMAHLASAYGTPSVVLFGPVSPARWGPPPRARHAVLWAGRVGDPHGRAVDPGLLVIEPLDVLREIDRLRSLTGIVLREGSMSTTTTDAATSSSASR